jgi:hypothetical protein
LAQNQAFGAITGHQKGAHNNTRMQLDLSELETDADQLRLSNVHVLCLSCAGRRVISSWSSAPNDDRPYGKEARNSRGSQLKQVIVKFEVSRRPQIRDSLASQRNIANSNSK